MSEDKWLVFIDIYARHSRMGGNGATGWMMTFSLEGKWYNFERRRMRENLPPSIDEIDMLLPAVFGCLFKSGGRAQNNFGSKVSNVQQTKNYDFVEFEQIREVPNRKETSEENTKETRD